MNNCNDKRGRISFIFHRYRKSVFETLTSITITLDIPL